jgi:hypothetical protein
MVAPPTNEVIECLFRSSLCGIFNTSSFVCIMLLMLLLKVFMHLMVLFSVIDTFCEDYKVLGYERCVVSYTVLITSLTLATGFT